VSQPTKPGQHIHGLPYADDCLECQGHKFKVILRDRRKLDNVRRRSIRARYDALETWYDALETWFDGCYLAGAEKYERRLKRWAKLLGRVGVRV